MLNHKKLSAKVCSVALTLAMVFTAMMPTAAFASGPTLTIKGDATLTVDYGTSITLTAEVTGGSAANYQWYSSGSQDLSNPLTLPGQSGSSLTVSATNAVGTPIWYFCKANGGNFGDWTQSDNAVKVSTQQATIEDKSVSVDIKSKAVTDQTVDLSTYLVQGASYGTVTKNDSNNLITGSPTIESNTTLKFSAAKKDPGTEATITVAVPASTNYKAYNVAVTIRVTPFAYAFKATTNGPNSFDQDTTLTVESTGDEPGDVTYQWYQAKSTESGEDDTPVGSNSKTYTVPAKSVSVGDTAKFYCSVTGGNVGNAPVKSNVVDVTTTQATITPPQEATQYIGLNGESVSYPLPKPSEGQEYDAANITTENSSNLINASTISLEGNTLKFKSNIATPGVEATITVPTKGDKNYASYDTVIKFTTQKSELTAKNLTELEAAFSSIPQGGTIKLVDASTNFQSLTSAIELNSEGHGIVTIDLNGFSITGKSGNAAKGLIDLTSAKGTGLKIINTGDSASITGNTQGYTIKNTGAGSLDISGISVAAGTSMEAAIGNDEGAVTISGKATTVNGEQVTAIKNTGAGSITVSDEGTVKSAATTIDNTAAGKVTVSGGEVSSTSTTDPTISNTAAGTIAVSDGTVSGKATAIDNTAAGNVTVSGGEVSSTATDKATIQNTGTGSITVSGGTVSGKATGTATGTIKATGGKVTITGTAVVTGNSGDDYAVYYTAPATAAIDESVKASITGKTDRVIQTIAKSITIGTAAPVTLAEIGTDSSAAPQHATVTVDWEEDNGLGSFVPFEGTAFQVGKTYKSIYTYKADDGYQFDSTISKDDVTVTNSAGLSTDSDNKLLATSDPYQTLTVALKWKPTTKITLSDQTADASVKSDASAAAWPLPVLTDGRTYSGTAAVGSADDLGLTSLSVSMDGLLLFTRGKDEGSHTTKVTVPVSGGTNYNDYDVTVTVTATDKEPVTIDFDSSTLNKVYDGKAMTEPEKSALKVKKYAPTPTDVSNVSGFEFKWYKNEAPQPGSIQRGDEVTSLSKLKDAGNYIVSVKVAGADPNYVGTSADLPFTISKAPVTIAIKPHTIKEGTDLSIAPTLVKDTDYTVEGLISGESFPTEPVFAYEPALGTASAGQAVKIVLTNKDAVAPDNGNYDLTCDPADVTVTSAAPTPPTPSGQYTVTINGGYDATGAGSYAPGNTVTLTAGSRSGYSFSSWTLTGVTVTNVTGNTITFPMPGNDVTATINWSYNGGGSSGGGGGGSHSGGGGGSSSGSSSPSTTPSTPSAPSKPAGSTAAFSDIANHWARQDIEFVAEKGLMSGTGNGQFSPDENMTRGMFVTTLGRLAGVNTASYSTDQFSDVQPDAYYAAYVNWAAEKGIVSGTSATTFSPDQPVTRQEMAVMMSNYSKAMGETLPQTHQAAPFSDSSAIAGWATEAVQQMEMAGIISGRDTGAFDPTGTATRAEVASVLHRFVEAIGK